MSNHKNLNDIDLTTEEGQLLIAALGQLSTQADFSNLHPDEILRHVVTVREKIYTENKPAFEKVHPNRVPFTEELERLVNRYSLESFGGNTPDFILAQYLVKCLQVFGETCRQRSDWYGKETGSIDIMG
jgi:hypothetical protein